MSASVRQQAHSRAKTRLIDSHREAFGRLYDEELAALGLTRRTLEPCGTRAARERHHRRGEECSICPQVQRRLSIAECGTDSGYNRHRRRGEQTCLPCRAAHSEKVKAARSYPHRRTA